MSDLKELWDKAEKEAKDYGNDYSEVLLVKELREKQGMFFWERGGKQFVLWHDVEFRYFENLIESAKETIGIDLCDVDTYEEILWARDFLDCVDCIGKKFILAKELVEKGKRLL